MKNAGIKEHLREKMKDPCFGELYELEAQKLNIAKKIIAYRIENALTQKELAERTGITQQQISKIENG